MGFFIGFISVSSAPKVAMTSKWQFFQRNLGEWHGTFASLDSQQQEQSCTSSILILEQGDEQSLVLFSLKRWADASLKGDAIERGDPLDAMTQEVRNLGKQVVFFPCGTFSKGSMQVAPFTPFGGEFGFLEGDRRHRLVILYDAAGSFDRSVLIREFRADSEAIERPALDISQLAGVWTGDEHTVTADWPEVTTAPAAITLDSAGLADVRCLPDGGGFRLPQQISHRDAFAVEAFWKTAPNRLQRLVRRYDATGAWLSASQAVLTRG